MNKKYLKENNLYEAHKQFMRLCEWTNLSSMIINDEEDNDQDMNMGQDMPQGNQNGNMGNDGNQPMNDPMMGGEGDPNADMNQPMGDDAMGGGEMPPMNGQDPMMGGEDMNEMPPMDDQMMGDNMGEDEEVIDVDDITNAQEKMNDKVNVVGQDLGKVNDKIEALMQSLSNMEQMINNNNAEIASFKQEFEKRNPTQTEKLNLRSLDSYPFNVNPKDYWKDKGIDPNSNYSGYSDNDKSTTQEYEITNSDVDDFDEKMVEDSFNIEDDLKQSIEKIFGL